MTDLWGFLLQTLTASGAAVLLLIVKAMFRDKLSPGGSLPPGACWVWCFWFRRGWAGGTPW